MPTVSATEFRVRRIDPTRPDLDITWWGPSTSQAATEGVANREKVGRRDPDEFVVERRTVTTTTTEWEPAP
jgi:hypothetical protein